MNTLYKRMRLLEIDHEPEGYPAVQMKDITRLCDEIKRLNCNNIECHFKRDVLESIYEAMHALPCNGIQGILCAAAQEIAALRGI